MFEVNQKNREKIVVRIIYLFGKLRISKAVPKVSPLNLFRIMLAFQRSIIKAVSPITIS